MPHDLVTIITPCYNASRFISRTIESVLNQTYPYWEMLIIDDCSSDNSDEIILEYARNDSRIEYLKTDSPSGSPSQPRNIGIDHAQGKYIAFLDADDLWLPNKLEEQVSFMESNEVKLSYSYYEKMSWDEKRNNRVIKTREFTTYNNLLKSNSIPCLTSMIRSDIIGDTRFKGIPQEDFCFWLDILRKGHEAYNMCTVTALYRVAKSSRSSNKIDMFKGYWNVIYNHQQISLLKSCYYMTTYTIYGLSKFIK